MTNFGMGYELRSQAVEQLLKLKDFENFEIAGITVANATGECHACYVVLPRTAIRAAENYEYQETV